MSHSARALVEQFERQVDPDRRRRTGVHYTPPGIARMLVERAIGVLGRVPSVICDPACGAGSFLVEAADALHARGVPAREIVEHRLVGGELDPHASAAAVRSMAHWAEDHGAPGAGPLRVVIGDAVAREPGDWPGRPADGFDLVVGNPPFLGQLSSRTARSGVQRRQLLERFPGAAGYADTAALFLLGALDLLTPDGVVCLLQPQSFLSARDTSKVRASLVERAELRCLWGSQEQLFDASVRVCAPILRRAPGASGGPVQLLWGAEGEVCGRAEVPVPGRSWGPLLAGPLGVPPVPPLSGAALATVATATAGFRDQFYGLCGALVDESDDAAGPPLVTVGMVEPGWCEWGAADRRIGGRKWRHPRVDCQALADRSPQIARWAGARQVPKVLVATQTRVVEAAPDPLGQMVPMTPLISVEPRRHQDVWLVTAALLAPPVSVGAVTEHLGAGLAIGALRWSASSVLGIPLPTERNAWERGARVCQNLAEAAPARRTGLLEELGSVMAEAYGVEPGHPSTDWWRERALR
jgi:hypothetical protein